MSANCNNKMASGNSEAIFVPKIWQEREDSNPRPLVLEFCVACISLSSLILFSPIS